MPVFELDHNGQTYEVDAPDQNAAMNAFQNFQPQNGVSRQPLQAPSTLSKALEPITSLPSTYQRMVNEGVDQMSQGANRVWNGNGVMDRLGGAGQTALGALGYLSSPINAPLHTIVGKPIEENTGIPSQYSELAASLLLPGGFKKLAEEAPEIASSISSKFSRPLKLPAPPSVDSIRAAAVAGFEHPEVKSLLIDPNALKDFAGNAQKKLLQSGINQRQAENTFGILEDLKKFSDDKLGEKFNTPLTYNDIRSFRDSFGNEAANNSASATATQRRAGMIAKSELDRAFSKLSPDQVIAGDISKANPILQTANKNYSVAEKMDTFGSKMREAEINATKSKNLPNEQQSEAKKILLQDERKNLNLDEEQISALERLSSGSTGENIKRSLGEYLAPRGMGGLIAHGAEAGAGFVMGGPLGMIALPLAARGVGSLLKASAAKSTAKNVGNVLSSFSDKSPLAQVFRTKSPLYNSMTTEN